MVALVCVTFLISFFHTSNWKFSLKYFLCSFQPIEWPWFRDSIDVLLQFWMEIYLSLRHNFFNICKHLLILLLHNPMLRELFSSIFFSIIFVKLPVTSCIMPLSALWVNIQSSLALRMNKVQHHCSDNGDLVAQYWVNSCHLTFSYCRQSNNQNYIYKTYIIQFLMYCSIQLYQNEITR